MKTGLKIILCLIFLAFAIVIGLFFYEDNPSTTSRTSDHGIVTSVPIVLSFDITTERPFTAQVFWTEDDADRFSKEQQTRKKIDEGASHIEITIPADIVHGLRFDFGSNPGKVSISNMKIKGTEEILLHPEDFTLFSKDVETHQIVNDTLIITSNLPDPFMAYSKPIDVLSD